jgi:hypothetical protein
VRIEAILAGVVVVTSFVDVVPEPDREYASRRDCLADIDGAIAQPADDMQVIAGGVDTMVDELRGAVRRFA